MRWEGDAEWMFQVGDLIMYGSTGVCRVEEITTRDFDRSDPDKLYYTLQPVYQTGVIYAPVENTKVFMRPVISKEKAYEVIDQMPVVESEIFRSTSTQQLSKHYQSVIDEHEILSLISLTKSIHRKKLAAEKQNRHLGQIDKKYMKRAEDLLFGELAAALNIPRDEIGSVIRERLGDALQAV